MLGKVVSIDASSERGTELHTVDVDAGSIHTAADFDQRVRRPWLEHGVLLLRKEQLIEDISNDAGAESRRRCHRRLLSPAQMVEFSRYLGELDIHSAERFLVPEHPEILQITNRKKSDGSPLGFAEAGR